MVPIKKNSISNGKFPFWLASETCCTTCYRQILLSVYYSKTLSQNVADRFYYHKRCAKCLAGKSPFRNTLFLISLKKKSERTRIKTGVPSTRNIENKNNLNSQQHRKDVIIWRHFPKERCSSTIDRGQTQRWPRVISPRSIIFGDKKRWLHPSLSYGSSTL